MYLKRVKTGSKELSVAVFFSQKPQKGAPDNHCVPILDTFEDPDEDVTYMVMPFLRYADDPPFKAVDDVIDMVTQLLEVRWLVLNQNEAIPHLPNTGIEVHARQGSSSSVSQ